MELTQRNKQLQTMLIQNERKSQDEKDNKQIQKSNFISLNNTIEVMSNLTKR